MQDLWLPSTVPCSSIELTGVARPVIEAAYLSPVWAWLFPIIRGPILVVPTKRILAYLGLFEGPLFMESPACGPSMWIWDQGLEVYGCKGRTKFGHFIFLPKYGVMLLEVSNTHHLPFCFGGHRWRDGAPLPRPLGGSKK